MKLNSNESLALKATPVMTRKNHAASAAGRKAPPPEPGNRISLPCCCLSVFRCVYYDTLAPAMQPHFCADADKSRHISSISRQFTRQFPSISSVHVSFSSQIIFSPYRDNVQAVYDKCLSFPLRFI